MRDEQIRAIAQKHTENYYGDRGMLPTVKHFEAAIREALEAEFAAKGKWDAKFHAFLEVNKLMHVLLPKGTQLTDRQADAVHDFAREISKDLTSGEFVYASTSETKEEPK